MDLGLAGRSIVVTGGSSGLGLATARLLLGEGAIVTICGRDMERLAAAQADLDSSQLLAVEADVIDAVAAQRVIASAIERAGRLDGVAAVADEDATGAGLTLIRWWSSTRWRTSCLGCSTSHGPPSTICAGQAARSSA